MLDIKTTFSRGFQTSARKLVRKLDTFLQKVQVVADRTTENFMEQQKEDLVNKLLHDQLGLKRLRSSTLIKKNYLQKHGFLNNPPSVPLVRYEEIAESIVLYRPESATVNSSSFALSVAPNAYFDHETEKQSDLNVAEIVAVHKARGRDIFQRYYSFKIKRQLISRLISDLRRRLKDI